MLQRGRGSARRKHALQAQAVVRNLCVGCLDDQAVLLTLLHGQAESSRWRAATHFERRFAIQGYWEDYVGALPRAALTAPADDVASPIAAADATARPGAAGASSAAERVGPPVPWLSRQVLGRWRVPFSIHFAGCQLCSGKADAERAARCWPAFRETARFAEDQATRPWGLVHAPEDRGGASDAPLQPRHAWPS
eukprot:scaffold36478_cov60-Phaeocystis_antarctica.AAC.2